MNTLYARLALLLAAAFAVVVAVLLVATRTSFGRERLIELAAFVIVASVAFALLAALCVYKLFTRRLEHLAGAIETFVQDGFTTPLRVQGGNPNGDEIDRLSAHVERMSERIARQLEQLQHTDAWRRELLANVSHDLRTPLASIQGYLEILLLKHGTLPPEEQRSYLEIATRHSERLSKLIRDLFQLAKLEAHEVTPHPEPFSMAELVQDVVQKFRLAAESRGLHLHSQVIGQQVQADGDIAMVESVLENLIENALRHTPRSGHIRVEVERQSGRVAVRVSDTGCGIAPEDMAKLFERYYHVDRGEAGVAAGTGLGLAIVRRIVELHGSAIRVESTPGQGATFGFDLPVTATEAPAPRAIAAAPAAPR
jgi:signal transduction histidine kinase